MNYLDVHTFNSVRTLLKLCEKIDAMGVPEESTVRLCLDKLEIINSYCEVRLKATGITDEDLTIDSNAFGQDAGKPIDLLAKDLVNAISKDKILEVIKHATFLIMRVTAYYEHKGKYTQPVWKPIV